MRIQPARSQEDLDAVILLFRVYAESLDIDLSFQDFDGEMALMPGKYAPPKGELLLARDETGAPVGCVGLRALDAEGCCEMKRLYVVPQMRGLRLGHALADAIIETAQRLGYREMRLDTLPDMTGAQALYGAKGFEPMPAYYDTPIAGTLFMRRYL